jgi:fusaric acid resistance family protein
MASDTAKDSAASETGSRIRSAFDHSFALAVACLISYLLATDGLSSLHSLSSDDDLLGGMWAVIATVFVYRETHRENVAAALTRSSATLISFALCLTYLALFPFHPIGLAVVIGLGTFWLMAIGRDGDVITAGITSTVVLVVAAVSPDDVWQQAMLRIGDTAIGIAVGVCASWIALRVTEGQVVPRGRARSAASPPPAAPKAVGVASAMGREGLEPPSRRF